MYRDEEYLALSGIQHFAFCRRQWALIHIEKVWEDNLLTVQGDLMHARAHDEAIREHRGDSIVVRGLTVTSPKLGIWGKCDVVEFHSDDCGHPLAGEDGLWSATPVEYKRGKSKECDADRLQLCAQAICLEEMLAASIRCGCLYYGATHSREKVLFDGRLRKTVCEISEEMHSLYARQHVPKVKQSSRCHSCSLSDVCTPKASYRSAGGYIDRKSVV